MNTRPIGMRFAALTAILVGVDFLIGGGVALPTVGRIGAPGQPSGPCG